MDSIQGETSYDTIIIGCGMAGLAAGIRLAMFDKRVLILEKHNAPGGLNSFYFQAGRKFDVGLHAVTNFVPPGVKGTPLAKIFRQLRIPREAFQLNPQMGSRVAFPGVDLRFQNGFELIESDVADAFPGQIDGFRRLRAAVLEFDALDLDRPVVSARKVVSQYLSDPVLEDMIFCPLMYYGSARERDMDFDQFVTLWRAVFEEGFGRPLEGVRVIIRALLDKYRSLGGERRMRCGVRRILTDGPEARGVELETGEQLFARQVISTAGKAETVVLCGESEEAPAVRQLVGRLSFAETISVLAQPPAALGANETIIFFNDSPKFHYEQSQEPIDLRSGVICMPNNYLYPDGEALPEGLLRVTSLANHRIWKDYDEDTYQQEKAAWYPRIVDSALRFLPGLESSVIEAETVCTDMFTPRTVEKFTSHFGGAVYGATEKSRNGQTEYENLFLAGTDQGFLGIVGAMLSGISIANRYGLTT
ncbi:NAD(P)/FAD-dependent oxidoreductase [Puniceicoccales bacterium CK1056]|uniref:NAD(P)/FAD-dependent oxidoreductase n=1 Tax=Oceanipulchritudo coccoides TaxID=2706888 RepID=A0A6B2M3E1_9BACT|nr:FAD-dependent oxidoreductase [Oceanipulchritudo coccoides]NDV63521.1 NAD(P)/FAD-dependent oxidoreductase [Oceanipulchritudo coccoides]